MTAKASETRPGLAEGSRMKLVEDFLADLHGCWQWHGPEILDRLSDERPEVFFRLMVKLSVVLHRRLGKPRNFDRRRIRDEALQRLGVSTIKRRPAFLAPNDRPGDPTPQLLREEIGKPERPSRNSRQGIPQ